MLNNTQLDSIKELINIGMGRGASVLNEMLGSHIKLELPVLNILTHKELIDTLSLDYGENLSGITMKYKGGMEGDVELIFNTKDAIKLVSQLSQDLSEDDEFDEIKSGTLCEIGNIVINAVIGSLSNILEMNLKYTVPIYLEGNLTTFLNHLTMDDSSIILLAKTEFIINTLDIEGYIFSSFQSKLLMSLFLR